MSRALIDTTVLFAAAYRRDSLHDAVFPILRSIDDGSLPEAVLLDYVLVETLNGLTTHAGHATAIDLLDRIEENARFSIDSLFADALATGKALFRQHEPLSFVDAWIIERARRKPTVLAVDEADNWEPNHDAVTGRLPMLKNHRSYI